MKLNWNISWFFCIVLTISVNIVNLRSQNSCGTSLDAQMVLRLERENLKNVLQFSGIQYIPMQVHIVLTDEGGSDFSLLKLKESICTLNSDFIPTGFQFYMEKPVHYIFSTKFNEHDYDIGEQMMKENNVDNVINVYLVSSPAGNCGYYTYRGDAVALSKSCTSKNSHTWSHELGHYFSLPHTFSGWEGINYKGGLAIDYEKEVRGKIENVERVGCDTRGDGFCDTPADYISNRWSCDQKDSSIIVQKDLTGESFKSDGSLIMSYSNDNCSSRFSNLQMNAMQNFLANRRSDLIRNIQLNTVGEFDSEQIFPLDSSTTKSKVNFSWNKLDFAESYIFQLSRNAPFSVLIKNIELKTNTIEVDSLLQGKKYYWRVIPISSQDFCAAESKSRTFQVDNFVSTYYSDDNKLSITPTVLTTNQSLVINSTYSLSIKDIQVMSINGQIQNQNIEFNYSNNSIQLNISRLPSGIYFIKLKEQEAKILIL
ncbi:MAG: T9SS type A sorting domain-containing protein [Saprospiraceae bacterium]|nr:T9SS type A sorting domain-containing protein [Saprospiraceae bacterium]